MRTNRPYVQIDPDVLERVRQIDLLSYLREFEPSNLVKVKGTSNVYCTAEHDSLKISNGKWYWWSRGFGGYSALDYLIKVKEYDFVEAVEILTGQTMADWKPPPAPKKDEPKVLLLPPKNKDCNRVIQYLLGVVLTIILYRSVLQTARSMRVPITTMLFLSAKMKAEHRNMPPCEALSAALSSRTHRAATSSIRSDFWQRSLRIPCIYLKPPLIYCPMPLI